MSDITRIREHMEVVGSDGQHVGVVDAVEGDARIKLTKNDPTAEGEHHYLSLEHVQSVNENAVQLNLTAEEARRQWKSGMSA